MQAFQASLKHDSENLIKNNMKNVNNVILIYKTT